jgi:hypothetical protein
MNISRSRARPFVTALAMLAAFAWSGSAHAQAAQSPQPAAPAPPEPSARADAPPDTARSDPTAREHADNGQPHHLRIGAIGGIGFPRALAIEPMVVWNGLVGIGGEYGALPAMTINGVQFSLWSLAGDVRVFPFRGAFFVGLRAGHQHLDVSTTISVATLGSAPEEFTLDSFFINPRIGFLWTSNAGFSLGVEAGVEFPLTASMSSTLPLSLAPSAQSTADTLGSAVIPTVDLLRIGLLL